jgi:hypothetical protein
VRSFGDQARELKAASAEVTVQTEALEKRKREARRDDFLRAATLVVEGLNSISVDIDRLLERRVPEGAWKKYLAGDKGIFTRRVLGHRDPSGLSAIEGKYREDATFREYVTRFVGQFEELLDQAKEHDRENMLSSTLLTADLGKLFLVLSKVSGRLR